MNLFGWGSRNKNSIGNLFTNARNTISGWFGGSQQQQQSPTASFNPFTQGQTDRNLNVNDPNLKGNSAYLAGYNLPPTPAGPGTMTIGDTTGRGGSSRYRQVGSLPDFNFDENAARSKAEGEFNPYYEEQIGKANSALDLQQEGLSKDYSNTEDIAQEALDYALKVNGIQRTNTEEDINGRLAQLAEARGMGQAQTAYERVKQVRSLVGDLASRGLQFGGMAAQAGGELAQGNLLSKQRAEAAYTNEVNAANTTKKRLLGDESAAEGSDARLGALGLEAGHTRSSADLSKKARAERQDIALRSLAQQRQNSIDALNEERKQKTATAVQSAWSTAYNSWSMNLNKYLASLGISI